MFKKFITMFKKFFHNPIIEIKLEEKNFTPFQWNLIQKHERYIAEKNRHFIKNHTGHWDEEYYQRKMKMMAKNKMN